MRKSRNPTYAAGSTLGGLLYEITHPDPSDSIYEMSNKRDGNYKHNDDEFIGKTDKEITDLSKDKSLPKDVRKKYIEEDKARKNRNKNKRKGC